MANRHLSRSIVMQSLFEWDFGNHKDSDIRSILERNADEFAPGMSDHSFIIELAENILKKRKDIDQIIEKAAPEWPIDKISIVDRNILRLGLYELLFSDRKEVPAKVAINESIELAKTFGGENSGKFVNGVLGSVYKELGEPGKDSAPAASKPGTGRSRKAGKGIIDPKDMLIQKLGGAVVYSKVGRGKDEEIFLALVHDIFGHWTLSKGRIESDEEVKDGTVREIKEEIGIDIKIEEDLGNNEYIASDPEHGKIRKQVHYFLGCSEHVDLVLDPENKGLTEAKWFKIQDILDLNFYNDILPIVTKAITILLKDTKSAQGSTQGASAPRADSVGDPTPKKKRSKKQNTSDQDISS